jgi:hypothetical protein
VPEPLKFQRMPGANLMDFLNRNAIGLPLFEFSYFTPIVHGAESIHSNQKRLSEIQAVDLFTSNIKTLNAIICKCCVSTN